MNRKPFAEGMRRHREAIRLADSLVRPEVTLPSYVFTSIVYGNTWTEFLSVLNPEFWDAFVKPMALQCSDPEIVFRSIVPAEDFWEEHSGCFILASDAQSESYYDALQFDPEDGAAMTDVVNTFVLCGTSGKWAIHADRETELAVCGGVESVRWPQTRFLFDLKDALEIGGLAFREQSMPVSIRDEYLTNYGNRSVPDA